MHKPIIGLFISLGFLLPALASAASAPKDKKAPTLTSVRIVSNNADPAKAKAGDTITLTFTTSEKIQTPIVLVNAKPVILHAINSSNNNWVASYEVGEKDWLGKVQYAIVMADMANNIYACTSINTVLPIFVKYCPTTDGSSVTVYKDTTPAPPIDTTAPVIAPHEDVHATTEGTEATVEYALPTATDDVDTSVAVSCAPASGSAFSLGTTTVTCTAKDAANNTATSTFNVVVVQNVAVPPPGPAAYIMNSQPDQSFLCGQAYRTWRYCTEDEVTFSFTDTPQSSVATIDLGLGSSMGTGTLQSVVIAKDAQNSTEENQQFFNPWDITISCFTDSAHTNPCSDWDPMTDDANEQSDGKYWTADFSSASRMFNQNAYYLMTIDDTGWEAAVYGSESLRQPYWIINGLR